jgi:predicted HicB family RNase H-like nuclease
MPYSKEQGQYSIQYAKKNLKRIPLDVQKEYYEEVIVKEAEKRNISVRAFILQAIEEKIEREHL